jgi:AraC-like DNA-binding protein
MTEFGTKAFTDPDTYRAGLIEADIRLVLTGSVDFGAEVSWLKMPCLRLLAIEETTPRVAFISLPPSPLFISFPLADDPPAVWNGRRLKRGEFVLHAPGDRFHHRTTGTAGWGLISISSRDLARYGRALLQTELLPGTRLLRPTGRSAARLLRLHAEAAHLVRRASALLARREVSRALEQELIHALVTAVGTAAPGHRADAWRRRAVIMVRFEDALAKRDSIPPLAALSAEIGISQRTLRIYCASFLGRSPLAYARLRRLNLARSALLKAHRATGVAELARAHGFPEPGRFAVAYRALFGETPRATLRRNSAESA